MKISYFLAKSLKETYLEYLDIMFDLLVEKYGKEYNFTKANLEDKLETYQIIIKSGDVILPTKKEIPKNKTYKRRVYRNKSYNRKPVAHDKQCWGRVWGNAYLDLKNNIYGKRCTHLKKDQSEYCKLHQMKLKHGKWGEDISEILKAHFLDYNQKNKLKAIAKSKSKLLKKRNLKN